MTDSTGSTNSHDASAAALGFYYQSQYALLTLIANASDGSAVAIEQLDDVALTVNGHTLLFQLKHSLQKKPPTLTLASVAIWKTIRVWIDLLSQVSLPDTTFHLVSVGKISSESPLVALCDLATDRNALVAAMTQEAKRVVEERELAKASYQPLPHSVRAAGCEAFLALDSSLKLSLLRRVLIKPNSPPIDQIEALVAQRLHLIPKHHRKPVARRLLEWWDQVVVHTLCGRRERIIQRIELEQRISAAISEIEEDKLIADFSVASPPEDYAPNGMLTRQINLVAGKQSDVGRAIREEWRAKEQRAKWITRNPEMRTTIVNYDSLLREHWVDRHLQMTEDCVGLEDIAVQTKGLELLRWTHEHAPNQLEPIAAGFSAHYYIRGTYQVLAIDLQVGWHPDYLTRLKE